MNKKGMLHDHYIEQVKVITTLTNGDFFGELSLIEKKPRAASVQCITDCFFLTLDKENFDRIISTKAKRKFMYVLE
jgi:CRP-like cAMP-binding protein